MGEADILMEKKGGKCAQMREEAAKDREGV